jgi:type II secretory ATPase GspE/PulE/Tfp pilus assembly ATPase PilB-like protein
VYQSQVDVAQGYTFANGLRSILRQDPNVVMVGEVRDPETADIAVQAALTGHLVLSTLHTNDAAGAIPRLLSLGVKPALLPSSLNAVVGQRLVRRLCEACAAPDTPDERTFAMARRATDELPAAEKDRLPKEQKFFKGSGCEACQGLGYRGQIGIYEVLVMTKSIKLALAEEGASDTRLSELAQADGMVTMLQDGILKALEGVTSLAEVLRVTKE